MSETKKPQAGEWWQYNSVRVRIAGVKLNGHVVCEYRNGSIATLIAGDWWQHIRDCTGWDWHPEAMVKAESPNDWVEITETHPGHIRRACDQVCGKTEQPDFWLDVNWTIGMPQRLYPKSRIRCRRKDVPQRDTPALKRVDVRLWLRHEDAVVVGTLGPTYTVEDADEMLSDSSGGLYALVPK